MAKEITDYWNEVACKQNFMLYYIPVLYRIANQQLIAIFDSKRFNASISLIESKLILFI